MERVRLGATGLKVSRLCLGTMIFGSQCDETAANAVLDAAEELGIDFIDVADVYPVPPDPTTWGRSEEIVGRWLRGKRERFVLATKFGNRVGPTGNDEGGSRKHVIEACEQSLRRLQVERIDLYWIHHPDPATPIEETLEAMDRLQRDGKVHYVGASNFEAWQIGLAMLGAEKYQLGRLAAIQPRYNLLHRQPERDLLPLARSLGLAVVPYNPLGAGMLTGKYRRGQEPPVESRFAQGDYGRMYQGRYWSERMFDVVDGVGEVARDEGITGAQVAVAWLLTREGVTAPIVGASRPAQLRENAAALDVRLSAGALERLNQVSDSFV
jgi:aryl-alcohol dehydrogenase (NADP+)